MSDILQFILEAYVCKKDQARATRGPSSDQAYDWCQKSGSVVRCRGRPYQS